jgi:L-ascorbate metabolism protein UlaG (beta-lactamase superfamily)
MKIKWLGHSCFLLTSSAGFRLIMDPFKPESYLTYPVVRADADAVTVSHEHFDHNYLADIPGQPEVLRGSLDKKINGIHIRGLSVFHDEMQGKERGVNTVFCVSMDGINVCHLGDLGHVLSDVETGWMGKVDVLLVPVGGVFTIGIDQADAIIGSIKPRIVIPMHYKTAKCQFLQWSADDFARGKKDVRKPGSTEIEIKLADMPAGPAITVLDYPG